MSVKLADFGQTVSLLYNNCEVINIDYWAIVSLFFSHAKNDYVWDPHHKVMDIFQRVDDFTLTIDISNVKYFSTTRRNSETDSMSADGNYAIERIRNGKDLCAICFGPNRFDLNWKDDTYDASLCGTPIKEHFNANVKVTESVGKDNHKHLIIRVP